MNVHDLLRRSTIEFQFVLQWFVMHSWHFFIVSDFDNCDLNNLCCIDPNFHHTFPRLLNPFYNSLYLYLCDISEHFLCQSTLAHSCGLLKNITFSICLFFSVVILYLLFGLRIFLKIFSFFLLILLFLFLIQLQTFLNSEFFWLHIHNILSYLLCGDHSLVVHVLY